MKKGRGQNAALPENRVAPETGTAPPSGTPGTKETTPERPGTFFNRVYALVKQIPPGKVMTYGQIAALLGGVCSAKIVGFAMSSAPAERKLPCHRVVNKAGAMARGPMFGGPEHQRMLLEREGVSFGPTGRIDMERCLYLPD